MQEHSEDEHVKDRVVMQQTNIASEASIKIKDRQLGDLGDLAGFDRMAAMAAHRWHIPMLTCGL